MTTIENIKAEIERRIEHYKEWVEFYKARGTKSDYDETVLGAYSDLLSFISTLESEKPSGPTIEEPIDGVLYAAACGIKNATGKSEKPIDGLEEEIKRYYDDWDGDCRYVQTARHFAKWGAEHLKK